MAMQKVKLEICGAVYPLTVEGDPVYYEELGKALSERMREMMSKSNRVSVTGAAVLCALDYLDELHRSNNGADNLRNQLKGYLQDATAAKAMAENAAREVEAMRQQLEKSQLECEKLRRELGYMQEDKA